MLTTPIVVKVVMHDVSVIVVCCIAAGFDNNDMLNLFLQSREKGKWRSM